MKRISVSLFSIYLVLLLGCNLSITPDQPRSDVEVHAYYLKDLGDDYYLMSSISPFNYKGSNLSLESDTITIEGYTYQRVFIAKIDPSNLKKGYTTYLPFGFQNLVVMYMKKPFQRMVFPKAGSTSREFLIIEKVVGMQ